MPGRVVVQWDKEDCADMGIIKVDLLGLGMMAVLQDAFTLINAEPAAASSESGRTRPLDLAQPAAQTIRRSTRMLQAADTIGVFQVESRAQMATLPRLKPDELLRPRGAGGDHPARARSSGRWCIRISNRRAGREPVAYDHPLLEPMLKRTLGVPLFQEQLLRMAMVVAGFTGGQAEELRRAMGFKRSEQRMKQIEVQLREGMAAQRHHRARWPIASCCRSPRLRSTAFPSRTPPASRCSPMPAPISRRITRRRSTRRC